MASKKKQKTNKIVEVKKKESIIRLDLGCGQRKEEGWIGVDKWEGADVVMDLFTFPWPWADNSVSEIRMIHFFEHVPGELRYRFMNECYRIMKVDARLFIVCPYYASMGAVQDADHKWPPICDASFWYYNKKARIDNRLDHYPIDTDFDISIEYVADAGPPLNIGQRNEDFRFMAIKHYINVVQEIKVTMVKKYGR